MAINGFDAYDSTISQNVLVMTSVLCFLADSPMHAEITNTHVPGNALNSCRYCVLGSESLAARKKMPYIAKFTQKNMHGSNVFPIFLPALFFRTHSYDSLLFQK
jgi:protein involved in ribonucleotide reduction